MEFAEARKLLSAIEALWPHRVRGDDGRLVWLDVLIRLDVEAAAQTIESCRQDAYAPGPDTFAKRAADERQARVEHSRIAETGRAALERHEAAALAASGMPVALVRRRAREARRMLRDLARKMGDIPPAPTDEQEAPGLVLAEKLHRAHVALGRAQEGCKICDRHPPQTSAERRARDVEAALESARARRLAARGGEDARPGLIHRPHVCTTACQVECAQLAEAFHAEVARHCAQVVARARKAAAKRRNVSLESDARARV